MKKKIIIPIVIAFVLIVGIVLGLLIFKKDKAATIITLDINPSIELSLDKDNKIIEAKALNDDAKKIVDDDFKGKELDEALEILIENLKENGYVHDGNIEVVLYSEGELDSKEIEGYIFNSFNKKDVNPYVVVIKDITKEDKELAKKHNITPAKAAYINGLLKDNEDLSLDELLDKPIMELKEMKETGKYCDEGYSLEGDFCLKEKERVPAKEGKVCPEGYFEVSGTCYKEGRSIDTGNLSCREDYQLVGEDCIRTEIIDPVPDEMICKQGEKKTRAEMGLTGSDAGDANDVVCVDLSNVTHPVTPCEANDGTEYTIANGKCYWHRAPVIDTGCPGKQMVNGECWDDATGIYICRGYRDGDRYTSRDAICPNSIKYYDPVVVSYKCENDFELKDGKCVREFKEPPQRERTCEEGYQMKFDRCIDGCETVDMTDGYVCDDPSARVDGKTCVIYDFMDAKHK